MPQSHHHSVLPNFTRNLVKRQIGVLCVSHCWETALLFLPGNIIFAILALTQTPVSSLTS